MRLFRYIIAVCSLAILAAGCAEGPVVREERLSQAEYLELVADTQDRIADASALLVGRAIIEDDEGRGSQDIIEGVDSATDDLDAKRPPEEWDAEHRELVDALRDWSAGLETVVAANESGNESDFERGKAAVAAAEVRIRATTEQLVADVEQDSGGGST